MAHILIVDDVPAMREQYAYDLGRLGDHTTLTAASGAEAIQVLESEPVDCVILDLEMPGTDGFDVLRTMRHRGWQVPVIVYTGTGDYDRCVRAVKLGAYSFISKEEPLERVANEVQNALAWSLLNREVATLRRRTGDDSPLIGDSRTMTSLKESIGKLARIPSAVLILGESGCGKELVARQLHGQSDRQRKPFVAVNCAALPENLTESELFGHERGAFTGADRTRKGAFEVASGGSLFLDEIGELPAAAQAKLLRVLEDRCVVRVGATAGIKIDTRVIAATNRDLDREVGHGRFRNDLLFRLNVHTVRVPPLRERLADLPQLVEHFLTDICRLFGVRTKSIDPAAVRLLQEHDWRRNNVRELRNVIERMVLACEEATIGVEHVPADLRSTPPGARPPDDMLTRPGKLKDLRATAESRIILAALERNQWHITRTAAELGLADHSSLLKIMRKHGIRRP